MFYQHSDGHREQKALGLVLAPRSNLNQWEHKITLLLYNMTRGRRGGGRGEGREGTE